MTQLSRFFSEKEFTSSRTAEDNGIDNTWRFRAHREAAVHLCQLLDVLRIEFGKPLFISSGYRVPELNKLVGGVTNSLHMDGLAADITVPKLQTEELRNRIEGIQVIPHTAPGWPGGLGFYPNEGFIHLGLGERTRWTK